MDFRYRFSFVLPVDPSLPFFIFFCHSILLFIYWSFVFVNFMFNISLLKICFTNLCLRIMFLNRWKWTKMSIIIWVVFKIVFDRIFRKRIQPICWISVSLDLVQTQLRVQTWRDRLWRWAYSNPHVAENPLGRTFSATYENWWATLPCLPSQRLLISIPSLYRPP